MPLYTLFLALAVAAEPAPQYTDVCPLAIAPDLLALPLDVLVAPLGAAGAQRGVAIEVPITVEVRARSAIPSPLHPFTPSPRHPLTPSPRHPLTPDHSPPLAAPGLLSAQGSAGTAPRSARPAASSSSGCPGGVCRPGSRGR